MACPQRAKSDHVAHAGPSGPFHTVSETMSVRLPLEQHDVGPPAHHTVQATRNERDQERIRQLEQKNASQRALLDNREPYENIKGLKAVIERAERQIINAINGKEDVSQALKSWDTTFGKPIDQLVKITECIESNESKAENNAPSARHISTSKRRSERRIPGCSKKSLQTAKPSARRSTGSKGLI